MSYSALRGFRDSFLFATVKVETVLGLCGLDTDSQLCFLNDYCVVSPC